MIYKIDHYYNLNHENDNNNDPDNLIELDEGVTEHIPRHCFVCGSTDNIKEYEIEGSSYPSIHDLCPFCANRDNIDDLVERRFDDLIDKQLNKEIFAHYRSLDKK